MNARIYTGADNLHQIIEFRRACTTPENINDYPAVSDVYGLCDPGAKESDVQAQLWMNELDEPVAVGIVQVSYGNLYFFIHPHANNDNIAPQIFAWASAFLGAINLHWGTSLTLDTASRSDDTERVRLLEQHDFVLQNEQTLRMARSLAEPIAEPQLPEGFVLRHVEGQHEVEKYVEMYRDAFGTQHMTVEHRLSVMRNPDYKSDLDLLAVAPDGTFAAFCISNIREESISSSGQKEGEIEIIGTRPAFCGMGLGKAMLLAGLQSLRAYGVETATLGTSSSNTNAVRLYESVGFRITKRILWFSRSV